MKVLIAGLGMQGKAALYDLIEYNAVSEVIVADSDFDNLEQYIKDVDYQMPIKCEYLDASDLNRIDYLLMQYRPDIVIELLPKEYIPNIVKSCIKNKIHIISSSFFPDSVKALSAEAENVGITILHELGMDPGLDLIFLGDAVRSLDTVEEIFIYGAGIPTPEASTNFINYKESWTFEGVLSSYNRPAHIIENGQKKSIPGNELFLSKNIHGITIDKLGELEAFPNGNALEYIDILNLEKEKLYNIGRYTMRWPGHCNFWKTIADLKLLDNTPVIVDDKIINKRKFLNAAIAPHIQYKSHEKDLGIIRVKVTGIKDGKKACFIYQVFDTRDMDTGFTAMNRLVGYTISIGAQMIVNGAITKRGIAYTARDVPGDLMLKELKKRNINVEFTSEFI